VPFDATQETRQQIIQELNLNEPVYVQYVDYLSQLVHFDLGYSYLSGIPVSVRIFNRIGPTVELGIAAIVIAIALSIPLGVLSALRRNSPIDYGATIFSLAGISIPNFWLGIMLILVFAVHYDLLPTSGRPVGVVAALELLLVEFDPSGLMTWLSHILLPAVTLGTYMTAMITRLTRSELLDELGKAYVGVMEANGLPQTLITFKHVLRNSLIPVITVIGLQMGHLINGAVVVEEVFAWPGVGRLLINSINVRDWPMVQGVLIFVVIGWVTINTVVDLTYAVIDPRITIEE